MLLVILRLVDRMCGKLLDLANVLIFFFFNFIPCLFLYFLSLSQAIRIFKITRNV